MNMVQGCALIIGYKDRARGYGLRLKFMYKF
jgi:hypothetical protein